MLNKKVKLYLDSIDLDEEFKLDDKGYKNIASKINEILQIERVESVWTQEDILEHDAFFLSISKVKSLEFRQSQNNYFPSLVHGGKVRVYQNPPKSKEECETIINYWEKRANQCKNPILVSRYADLVVHFKFWMKQEIASKYLFKKVINSNIKISLGNKVKYQLLKSMIWRSLSLSIEIHDEETNRKIKNEIIRILANTSGFFNKGLMIDWLFYTLNVLLLSIKNKWGIFSLAEEKDILNKMDNCIDNYPLWITHYTWPLEIYAYKKKVNKLKHIFNGCWNYLAKLDRTKFETIIGINRLLEDLTIYINRFPSLKSIHDQVLSEKQKFSLTNEELLSSRIKLFNKNKYDDLAYAMWNTFYNGKHSIDMMFKKFFKFFQCGEKINVTKLTIDTIERYTHEPNGPIIINGMISSEVKSFDSTKKVDMWKGKEFYKIFIKSLVFFAREMKTMYKDPKAISEYFLKGKVFQNMDQEVFEKTISTYWENEFIISNHLMVPRMEEGFRNLREIECPEEEIDRKKNTLYNHIKKVLSNNKFPPNLSKKIFKILVKEAFLNKDGKQIRNKIAHGIKDMELKNEETAVIIFYMLIFLRMY